MINPRKFTSWLKLVFYERMDTDTRHKWTFQPSSEQVGRYTVFVYLDKRMTKSDSVDLGQILIVAMMNLWFSMSAYANCSKV